VVHRIPYAANELLVEATLEAAHPGPVLVDLRGPTPLEPVTAWLRRRNYLRGFGAVVGRVSYKTTFTATVLAEAFDGLAYLPEVGRSTPLGRRSAEGESPFPTHAVASEPRRSGGAAPSPGAGSGRCSRSGSAPGSPGAPPRPPRTDRPG
jgi:hypothetical protein